MEIRIAQAKLWPIMAAAALPTALLKQAKAALLQRQRRGLREKREQLDAALRAIDKAEQSLTGSSEPDWALFSDVVSLVAKDFCWAEEPHCSACPLLKECPTGQERKNTSDAKPPRLKPRYSNSLIV